MAAYISNIQKFCVHDGPGIRTVVFFMGCPLRCKWCQNPENFYGKSVILFNPELCTGCSKCIVVCPKKNEKVQINRGLCDACGECAEICYVGAKSVCGEPMNVDNVFNEIIKDKVFFLESGGGLTLSGGEPLLYSAFVKELFSKVKQEGINTAIETSGYGSADVFETIMPVTDMFLYDIKAFSDDVHKAWTGVSNKDILANLKLLHKNRKRVIVRIPLIPGVNTDDEFVKIMDYLKTISNDWEVHLLPFHQVGSSKYAYSGEQYEMIEVPECSTETAQKHEDIANKYGFKVNIGGWNTK